MGVFDSIFVFIFFKTIFQNSFWILFLIIIEIFSFIWSSDFKNRYKRIRRGFYGLLTHLTPWKQKRSFDNIYTFFWFSCFQKYVLITKHKQTLSNKIFFFFFPVLKNRKLFLKMAIKQTLLHFPCFFFLSVLFFACPLSLSFSAIS